MRKILLLAALATTLLAPGALAHTEHAGGKPAAVESPLPQPAPAGTRDPRAYFTDADLTTQDARKVRFYSDMLKGRTVVLNVTYTNCTEACPLITKQLLQVREELGKAFGKQVFFVTLTSDPARDTPQALKAFAQKQGADLAGWSFLTGRKSDVDVILKRLGAWSENVEEHATVLYIMDVDAKRMRRMLPNLPPKAIAEAARIIATSGRTPAPGAN
ncbi:SCO family protein [Ramlibacter sp. AN1133]|uniref:SCO family protein n=1 Tax=Ramlibacter sp. AN1133 TaxID=3133429 RepID=UPI0030C07C0E